MKKTILLIFFFAVQALVAQTPEAQFTKANEAYADANYKEATRLYNKLLQQDWQSSELHFNLGNTYYKTGNIASSIYHYEMALLLSPGNKTYLNNLKFAEQKRVDEIEPIQKSKFDLQVENIINWFDLEQWSKIAIGFAILSLLCFGGFLFLKKAFFKRMFFTLFILFTLVCVLCYFLADKQAFLNKENTFGIIFAEESSVYSEPNSKASQLFLLHEGAKVKVEDEFRSYTKIRLGNDVTGWIESSQVKKLQLE